MRKGFDDKLKELKQYLTDMGILVEKAISLTNKALLTQSIPLAEEAIQCDIEIDNMEKEIEDMCLKLLLLHQPVARDLRVISAAHKMITDMERIGDQCADISEITIFLAEETYINPLDRISRMADATKKMVTDSIEAYMKKDLDLARSVMEYDNYVDKLFLEVKSDLTELIHKNSDNISQSIDLLMAAKYFERIGDHAENIAEWVEFSITGHHKKLKSSR